MPHRARARMNLHEGHPLLHARDDRAIAVGRQKIEHPKDRTKSKQGDYWEYHRRDWRAHIEFRRHRGGRPLDAGEDERVTHPADGGSEVAGYTNEHRFHGWGEVDLMDVAKPRKARKDPRGGFEMIPRPVEVLALDEESDDDFEIVERVAPAGRGRKAKKSFADVLKRRRAR